MSQKTTHIRPDMLPDNKLEPQHKGTLYLDRFIYKALTAQTGEEIQLAAGDLSDIQEQCLKHLSFLSEIECFHRSVADDVRYEIDEDRYTEVISFIAGLGAGLAGVTHQLSLVRPIVKQHMDDTEPDQRAAA